MTAESAKPVDVQTERGSVGAQGVARSLSTPPHLEPEPARVVEPALPADEQGTSAEYVPSWPAATLWFLAGTLLFAATIGCWTLADYLERWAALFPVLGFTCAVAGAAAFYKGLVAHFLEPVRPAANHFVAWGRLGAGVALTIIGTVAVQLICREKWAPDEAKVFATLMMISGPVLCGWAAYGTFVKDPSQRGTGWLMIATAGVVLAILLAWR